MNILSIQSWVSLGHVGNAAAVFPIQRLGHDVWAVNTVQFSNHTGYGAWTGQVFTGDNIRELVRGIAERGVLPVCDGVLSGYMGDVSIGEAVLDAVVRVKAANPAALYCCDPVIGDIGRGVFVRPGIPEFMRERAIAAADIITPNHFEFEMLAGLPARTDADMIAALDALHGRGPRVVLVTSVFGETTPHDMIDVVVSDRKHRWRVRTPKLSIEVNGAGDAIAALFFVHYLATRDAAKAMAQAVSSVYGVLRKTEQANTREIQLIAAQDEFIHPTVRFEPEAF